jgi:hypothetical protein
MLNELNAPSYKHHPIHSYCYKIHSTASLALRTTCGYQLCGVVPHGFATVTTFAVCGFATMITHDIVYHFHGSVFPHFTPVPILVSNNKVRVNYKHCPDPFFFWHGEDLMDQDKLLRIEKQICLKVVL